MSAPTVSRPDLPSPGPGRSKHRRPGVGGKPTPAAGPRRTLAHRLRAIATSPFVDDVRSGRLDGPIGVLIGIGVVLVVALVLGDKYWLGAGYVTIPGSPR